MIKFIKRTLLFIFTLIILAVGFVIYKGHKVYIEALNTMDLPTKIEKIKSDDNYVNLNSLPVYYKNAIVSVEDHRYYEHGPIDFIAIIRATVSNIRNKNLLEGGSTITQQVAKNLYFISSDTNSMYRKIAEIFMAYDLENNYSKDEILEFYINTIYFGDGYYGIESACNGYFDKFSKDMSLYEATMMAGVPNAPSVYAPTVNMNLALNRQRKVISTMVENGYLSQEQADELIKMQEKETN